VAVTTVSKNAGERERQGFVGNETTDEDFIRRGRMVWMSKERQ